MAAARGPVDLRNIETVRAGEPLAEGVRYAYLDGRRMEHVSAFNVAEGWIDVIVFPDGSRMGLSDRVTFKRHYGRVTYTMGEA